MWPFSRMERVHLDTFCREFFDTNVLNPTVAGLDVGRTYFETVQRSVAEADPGFTKVDAESFYSEMTLIRFEVFGLAWLHQIGDKHAAAQSAFTKCHLEERGRKNIWNNLEHYNQAIARSSTFGHSSDTAAGRAYLVFRNRIVIDLFDQWCLQGIDSKAVARASNRLFTDVAWEKGVTPAFLMLTLCGQLGCEVNEEAQFRLAAVTRGMYDGARESLQGIKVAT